MIKHYQHTSTTPLYVESDIKLINGDIYVKDDENRTFKVIRNGEIVLTNEGVKEDKEEDETIEEEKEEDKTEEDELLEDVKEVIDFSKMTKEELQAYASDKFSVDLNMKKSHSSLIKEIMVLEEK